MTNKSKAKAYRKIIDMNILEIPHTMSKEEANKALDTWLKRIGRK